LEIQFIHLPLLKKKSFFRQSWTKHIGNFRIWKKNWKKIKIPICFVHDCRFFLAAFAHVSKALSPLDSHSTYFKKISKFNLSETFSKQFYCFENRTRKFHPGDIENVGDFFRQIFRLKQFSMTS